MLFRSVDGPTPPRQYARQWHIGMDVYWASDENWSVLLGWREAGVKSHEKSRDYREQQTRVGLRITF